ncbi:hypothetical protein DDZ18_01465 [Marinicauda salina]|uniref:Peptidase S9 prolyl oligopeptidase catalytic domain-containing protein n=1 Tax=Marinicauda salina TaxID=2135793 RepID=A0A2U2BWC2_9PROT|nr:hypothetical protein DDZ18_01465 [Marinicauda salina]
MVAPPEIVQPQLSPDGQRLIYLRYPQPGDPPGVGRRLAVVDLSDPAQPRRRLLNLPGLNVRWIAWGNNERILLGMTFVSRVSAGRGVRVVDQNGDPVTRVLRSQVGSINIRGGDSVFLFDLNDPRFNTLFNQRLDRVTDFLPEDPEHILMPARTRRGRSPFRADLDLYRVNIYTGESRRVAHGRQTTLAWFTNARSEPVMRFESAGRGGRAVNVLARPDGHRRWRRVARFDQHEFGRIENEFQWAARSESHDEAIVLARSEETGTIGVFRYSFTDDALLDPIFLDQDHDVDSVEIDPFSMRLMNVRYADTHPRIHIPDDSLAEHVSGLEARFGPDFPVEPVQQAGGRILVRVSGPTEPGAYHLYDAATERTTELGAERPALSSRALAQVRVHRYGARDGAALFGYVTEPARPALDPPPLVVLPHGGPERRDVYGFDDVAQLLAAKGYLVFQPQFRGSYGFGRAFAEAGHGEWGGLMQDDVTDGVRSLLEAGLADPERVCIVGFSYGGYAALMGAVKTPDLYRCAVSGAGVADLPAMLTWEREREESAHDYLVRTIGDPDADMAMLESRSPARRAEEIRIPVLLLHGREDDVVPIEQSEMMEAALQDAGRPVTFIPNSGGHDLSDPGVYATVLFHVTGFLDEHLLAAEASGTDEPGASAPD